MKKFNGNMITLFAIVLNTATTNALEWPSWARWNTRYAGQNQQTWTQYGTQKGKAIFLGIKNNQKIAGAVVIGVGGLALAYKYRARLRSLRSRFFKSDPHQAEQNLIIADIKEYLALRDIAPKYISPKDLEKRIDLKEKLLATLKTYQALENPTKTQERTLHLLEDVARGTLKPRW